MLRYYMKRSEINRAIENAIKFSEKMHFNLPPFAFWTPEEWQMKGPDCNEIRDTKIGWDVTDFGLNNFKNMGRTLFTLRNGSAVDARYKKPYSQKAIFLNEGQKSPIHFHKNKLEDIMDFGSGNVLISFWHASEDGMQSNEVLDIVIDGVCRRIKAGETIRLRPGESVFCDHYIYHQFWAEEGCGHTISIEVANVCDDYNDNFWLNPRKRFPDIEEDEPPKYLLCNEYPNSRNIE